jgi:hypothetical protein
MADPDNRIVQYESLNWLGKTVFLAGATTSLASRLVDAVLERAADIVVETEKAFHDGLDPNVDDAVILDETDDRAA